MEEKIILDDTSFKALSSDSRVSILKNLNTRRMTLSELSKRLELENSTIKEHCNLLVKANLIKQIDEGRKWKYYELTSKGKNIIEPNLVEQIRVLVVLCLGAIVFGGILTLIIQPTPNLLGEEVFSTFDTSGEPMLARAIINETNITPNDLSEETQKTTLQDSYTTQQASIENEQITREFFVASISISIIAGLVIGWAFARKY